MFAQDAVITPEQARILATPDQPQTDTAPTSPSQVTAGYGNATSGVPRRFQYSFRLAARGVYDDNVNISSFDPMSDYYFAIEPSIYVGLGLDDSEGASSLSLIYRPSVYLFADQSDRDTVQHIVELQGRHRFGHLALSLLQDIQALDGTNLNSINDPTGHNANIDVGRAAKHQIYTTVLGASYDLTSKTFLSGGANYARDNYDSGQITSQVISGNLFINYNYSPKLVIGAGGTGGLSMVDVGSADQTFEQVNATVRYSVTAKVNLNLSGGVEFRQFGGDNGRGLYVSPVYDISGSYSPFDGTSISVSGSRRTISSASLGGTDFASTSFNVDVAQRFLRKLTLALSIGYVNDNYFSTFAGFSFNREDNFYYLQPSIDFSVTRFWSMGGYYLRRENNSSFGFLFGFEDNQVGLRSTIVF